MPPARRSRRKTEVVASWLIAAAIVAAGVFTLVRLTEPGGYAAFGIRAAPTPVPTATPSPSPTPIPALSNWELAVVERTEATAETRRQQLRDLRTVITFAANDIDTWSADAQVSIAVVVLDDSARSFDDRMVGVDEDRVNPSASLAKAYWVAAAAASIVDDAGAGAPEVALQRLDDPAVDVFEWSSNDAASTVVQIAGVDDINNFTRDLGMTATFLRQWRSGQRSSEQNPFGDGNTTSAEDAVRFLDALAGGDGFDAAASEQLRVWMKTTPDNLSFGNYHGVLGDRLPATVGAELMHKAGWLPPDCCEGAATSLIAMSLVLFDEFDLPDADPPSDEPADPRYEVPESAVSYALAISVNGGRNYERQQDYIAWTSCLVFQTLADPSHPCGEIDPA